jgi:sarcosine oxidase
MNHYEVIVVGGGVMGCATAYHLAKRGRRVLLLEQFAIGHERGSSHGHSRIFRLVYDAPDYVELARAAYPLWRELESEAGVDLLLQTGGFDFADPATQSIEDTRATLVATGVPFELLDHAAVVQRFPQFAISERVVGIYQPDTGILDATKCVLTLASEAQSRGAIVQDKQPVRQIQTSDAGIVVHTDTAMYAADRLVVTAGSWARPLLSQVGLDLPLTVTKEQFAFFKPHDPELFAPGRCPIFVHHMAVGPAVYGFPMYGLPGVKAAFHNAGPAIAPEIDDRDVDLDRLTELQAHLTRWLPQGAGDILLAQTCRYTCTPDHEFIIDQHPEYPQIVIGSPCSGHGFKFGVLIGSILADLTERGETSEPIERFRLGRFGL